jgi:outer membrane protein assembly factor BamB
MRPFSEQSVRESPPVQSGAMSIRLRLLALNLNESILAVVDSTNGDFLWETAVEGQLVGQPLLTDDAAISLVKSQGGVTRAVGRDLWTGHVRFELTLSSVEDGVSPLLALAGRDDFCAVVQGRLGRWDVWNAQMRWSWGLDAPQTAGVVVGQGRVAILTAGGALAVLDADTGRLLWRTALPADQNWAHHSVFYGDCLFAVSEAGHIYALEATTGRVKWRYDQPTAAIEAESTLWLDGVFAVAGTGIFDHGTRAKATQVAFRDAETGGVVQQLAIPGEIRYSTAVHGTYVIVTDQGIFGYRGPQGGGTKLN